MIGNFWTVLFGRRGKGGYRGHGLPLAGLRLTSRFGARDYLRMFKKRGLRLPVSYFLNAHLFDLVHKTDTHTWVPKETYETRPPNFDAGFLYMTSWTSEIKRTYNFLLRNGFLPEDYVFLDLGCGKGKVCLLWRLLELKNGRDVADIVGIDYYEPLVELARANHTRVFNDVGNFVFSDVIDFDFAQFRKPLVVYAYNPFNARLIANVANRLNPGSVFIYNNPAHGDVFNSSDFERVFDHPGWHPNAHTIVFRKISHGSP